MTLNATVLLNSNLSIAAEIDAEREITRDNISNQLQLLSDERAIELLPAIILIGCMMIVGIIGNSLIVYVFTKKFKKTTQTMLFVALACFDLITCSVAMPFEIFDLRFFFNFNSQLGCKLSRSMVTFPTLASNQVLLLIAVDRYRKVCCPLKVQITPTLAKKCILAVVFIAVLLTIPAYFLYGLRSAITHIPGLKGSDCATGDEVKDTIYPILYGNMLVLFFVFFSVTLSVLYYLIWRVTRSFSFTRSVCNPEQTNSLISSSLESDPKQPSASTQPKSPKVRPKIVMLLKTDSVCRKASTGGITPMQSSKQTLKSKSTIIAFAVTFVFILSFIPHLVLAFMKNIKKDFDYELRGSELVAFNIFLRSFLVNSVINPLIYAAMNPTFRRECCHLLRCFCCRKGSKPETGRTGML